MLSDFEKFIIRCCSRYSRSYWLLPFVQQEWASLDNEMRQYLNFQISVKPAFLWLVDWEKNQSYKAPYFDHTQVTFVLIIMVFIAANRVMWFWKKAFFWSNSWCFNTIRRILLIFCQCSSTLHYSEIKLKKFHQYWPLDEIVRRHSSPTEDPSPNTSKKVTFELINTWVILNFHTPIFMKSTHLIGKYRSYL